MSLYRGILRQKAVYWAPDGSYDAYGQPARSAGVEVNCRWDETTEEFIQPDGAKGVCSVKVLVDQDLEVGGLLWLGLLVDAEDTTFPDDPREAGALLIRSFQKSPTLKATEYVRTVFL